MSSLQYVGKMPDSDASVTHKKYVDNRYNNLKVDSDYIHLQTSLVTPNLATPSYVDSRDNLRAFKTEVDAGDNQKIPNSQKNQAGGVVGLDTNGYISPSVYTGLKTARPVTYKEGTIVISGTQTVLTTNGKEFLAGTLSIADPGYPYIIWPFANIQGKCSTPTMRTKGGGSYGQISILGPSDARYGWGITSGNNSPDFYSALPYGGASDTPALRTPIVGPLSLSLYLGLWAGTTFTFYSNGCQFYTYIFPV